MFIDSMPEHRESWEKWSDSFFLELLDKSLNDVPTSLKPLFEMSEQEINSWLEQPNFKEEKQQPLHRYIEFNNATKEFDLKSARGRYHFIKSFQLHQSQMIELEKLQRERD